MCTIKTEIGGSFPRMGIGTMIQKLPYSKANISMSRNQKNQKKKKLANNSLNANATVFLQKSLLFKTLLLLACECLPFISWHRYRAFLL